MCTTWCFDVWIYSKIITTVKWINILPFCVWWEHLRSTILADFFQYIRIKMTYIKWLKYATNNLPKNLGHFHTWSPFFSWVQQLRMTLSATGSTKYVLELHTTCYFGKHITCFSEQIRAMTHWCKYATGSPPIQR